MCQRLQGHPLAQLCRAYRNRVLHLQYPMAIQYSTVQYSSATSRGTASHDSMVECNAVTCTHMAVQCSTVAQQYGDPYIRGSTVQYCSSTCGSCHGRFRRPDSSRLLPLGGTTRSPVCAYRPLQQGLYGAAAPDASHMQAVCLCTRTSYSACVQDGGHGGGE